MSQKMDLLVTAFSRNPIREILDELTNKQLVEAHTFLWDKLVEIHFLTRKREFRRDEVTRDMVSSAAYQRQQGCDLRLDYCKGVECIWSNPVCAANKIKNNMEVMASAITHCLDACKRRKGDAIKTKKQEEVKVWLEN